ncbi:MAG: hydrolase [Firmicutes bacterium]|nr:hydrolase [Bacillota bacterium]
MTEKKSKNSLARTGKQGRHIPRLTGNLRAHSLQLPDAIWDAPGMVILGRRLKSVIFTTDVAIIRNCNADAVMGVYPFTPQQIISQTLISASSIPVLAGVGGGTTTGMRAVLMARDAEAHGAFGVVLNAPTKNDTIRAIKKVIDIPIIVTVLSEDVDIGSRIDAGVSVLNVSAASKTPEVVRTIRKEFDKIPIIATGGPTEETIRKTIEAGANTISYTPPSTADIFAVMMDKYREDLKNKDITNDATEDGLLKAIDLLI